MFSAVLNDQIMRRIARKAGNKRSDLGYELGLESADIEQIKCQHSEITDQAFHILLVRRHFILSLPTGTYSSHCFTKIKSIESWPTLYTAVFLAIHVLNVIECVLDVA